MNGVLSPEALELSSEEQITAERDETKYRVDPVHLGGLTAELAARLRAHRFAGAGANRLPDPHHYITTVYFDTASWQHYATSRRDRDANVKVRAREYYDVHSSLAELATRPDQVVKHGPWVFLEVKYRRGATTQKARFRLPRANVLALVSSSHGAEGPLDQRALEAGCNPEDLDGAKRALSYMRELPEPLAPRCVVNYRRASWQDPQVGLRITIDLGIAFYAPPQDLWKRSEVLVRSVLGRPKGGERHAIIEIKRRGAPPEWLTELLERVDARPTDFSKFVSAAEAVGAGAP